MPMVPKFFRAAAFAANVFGDMGAGDTNWLGAECEDLLEAAYAQPFFTRFLHCCLYWFFVLNTFALKPASLFLVRLAKRVMPSVFRLIVRKMLLPLFCGGLGFCFKQASVICQNLENRRRSASCHNGQETGIELFFQGLSLRWFQKPDHALNASNLLECFG